MLYDILIKNATIFDGTGARSFKSNLVIKNGKIIKIGEEVDEKSCQHIFNADKRYLCPGFIDIDNVSDHYLTLFNNLSCDNLIKQGITSIIIGHEGSSLAPLIKNTLISFKPWANTESLNVDWRSFKTFLNLIKEKGIGVNIGSLIGWNVMRSGLVGESFRNLSDFELKQLTILAKQSMREGSLGISFGFGYPSGRAISKREVLSVYHEIKKFNPLFSFNLRDESIGFLTAVKEVIDNAKEQKINTLITGFKVQNEDNFSNFDVALKLIENINAQIDKKIHFSIYPYDYTCQTLYSFLPDWLTIGGDQSIKNNLEDKNIVKKLVKELKQNKGFYKKLVLVDIENKYKMLKGKTFEAIAKNLNLSIEETIVKILSITQGKIIVLNLNLSMFNIDKGIKNNYSIVATNGMSLGTADFIDRRSTNGMIKYLTTYQKILPFENVINKITGMPKEKLGLESKGYIKIGMDADLVILNPQTIEDQSSIQKPMIEPKGIEAVIINGQIAYNEGKIINDKLGTIIRKH